MEINDKLIDKDKEGLYSVLFSNHAGFNLEEINDIFSEFGNVHNVRIAGNQTGICFVRYREIDEVIRAIKGLKCHPQIKLLEHKRKVQNRYSSERNQNSEHGCDGTKFIQQFSRQSNHKNDNNRNRGNQENKHHENFNNDLPWGPKGPNMHQKQNDLPWGQRNSNEDQKPNDLPWGDKTSDEIQKQSDQSWRLKSPNRYQEQNDEIPDLVIHKRKAMLNSQNPENQIPDLVTSDGKTSVTHSPIKKNILPAQEVIVANIHPKFGAPYILYLFDHFEPLAISKILIEPKSGKRYCHVYFKTAEDSKEVESLFDKKRLMDQRLIVLRPNRLAEMVHFK